MQLQARLVHAEPGNRVVEVAAHENGQLLGSALGEAAMAEEAEDRALARLLSRLNRPVAPAPEAPVPQSPARHDPQPSPQGQPSPARQPSLGLDSDLERSQSAEPPVPPPSLPSQSPTTPTESKPPPAEPSLPSLPRPSSATDAPQEPLPDPDDWSSELARIDLQLRRLGWQREQESSYLERAFGHPSRSRLTSYADLLAYLQALEALEPGCDPSNAPVPLRRRDLLAQCDGLLAQLGWDAQQGRRYLEQQFHSSSRQQLSDEQLLQFNMLLEGELIGV